MSSSWHWPGVRIPGGIAGPASGSSSFNVYDCRRFFGNHCVCRINHNRKSCVFTNSGVSGVGMRNQGSGLRFFGIGRQ